MRHATLVFPLCDDQVLLGSKKAGFGAGKYNGFGGKVEPGESIKRAAVRELKEEAGIQIDERDAIPAAVLTFLFHGNSAWDQVVHVFLVRSWEGEPIETNEMKPQWFSRTQLPFAMMWQDDRYWLPVVLAGKKVTATFTFGDDNETVIDARVVESEAGGG